MKTRLIYAIAIVLVAQISKAQTFGIKGGLNLSNMTFSESGTAYSPSMLTGFQFGPVVDFKLTGNVYLNTGVLYSLKGFNLKSVNDDQLQDASFFNGKSKLSYFELPVNITFKIPVKTKYKFLIQAGPYVGLSSGGTIKKPGIPIQEVFQYHNLNTYDYGVGAGAGVEMGPLVASLNYELGLLNLNSNSTIPATFKNKVFQISVAWMFWKLNK